MKRRLLYMTCFAVLALGACGQSEQEPATQSDVQAAVDSGCPDADVNANIDIAPGLTAIIKKKGYGRAAVAGDYADVHTTLWLYDENAVGGRGTEIWSSGGQEPFQFRLDAGQVIKGWDLGVECMLVGETRELKIAPELGYGARGKPPVPPNTTLLFEIELVKLTGFDEPPAQ